MSGSRLQVGLFRALVERLDWNVTEADLQYDCMGWTDMMDDLVADNGTCMVAARCEP